MARRKNPPVDVYFHKHNFLWWLIIGWWWRPLQYIWWVFIVQLFGVKVLIHREK